MFSRKFVGGKIRDNTFIRRIG